ncbi:hypothetical protein [Nocardia transvalensis]|uniref:hypothetical protein n=1 Tax=Nocardia transvalensis TaxID=37333 RepID=UPI0018931D06|nr:hypothetical protein [Nocardia transvalensis]MBF6333656.1 hypothetical protein [Nocardia transvalensis]
MSNDDYWDDDGNDEWQLGECDRCGMKGIYPEARAPFMPVCACDIGEGAPAHECECENWVVRGELGEVFGVQQ